MPKLYEANETVTVYPEETWVDGDGNTNLRASSTGTVTRAMIRMKPQSGTSSRRAEQMDEGYFTEQTYWVRFPRGSPGNDLAEQGVIGQSSIIEWNGQEWYVFGQPEWYNGSPRTRRFQFTIRRN